MSRLGVCSLNAARPGLQRPGRAGGQS